MQPTNKRWPWIAAAAAALIGGGLLLAHVGPARDTPAAAAVAATVKDGTMRMPVTQENTFEYTVNSLNCTNATISGVTPAGHLCIVGITIKNLSGTAAEPGISFAKAYDAQGTEYLADAIAQVRAGSALLNNIAPGARITDRLIYDVPKSATVTSVVLRETPSAAGIRIPLR